MPTLSGTWYSSGDQNTPDNSSDANTAKAMLWLLKAMLTGQVTGPTVGSNGAPPVSARWTLLGSSDGVAAAMDAVDRWGSSYDVTKLVRGFGGAARSWVVLKSPNGLRDGPWHMVIAMDGTDDSKCTLKFSKGEPTGGTTTVTPAGTSEFGVVPATANFKQGVAVTYRLNLALEANGAFVAAFVRAGESRIRFLCGLAEIDTPRSADLARVVQIHAYTDNADSVFKTDRNVAGPGTGLVVGGGSSMPSALYGRKGDNSAACSLGGFGLKIGNGSDALVNAANVSDYVDASDALLPCPVYEANPQLISIRGTLKDFYMGVLRADGSTASDGPTVTHGISGAFRFPMKHAMNMA